MDTAQVLTIFAVIATNLGTVLALYLQTDRKVEAIQQEMKDFHGRLAAIEERAKINIIQER
jgi:uncharacterized membrane protein (DUF106 family)